MKALILTMILDNYVVSVYDVGEILILILRFILTITAILGFGVYLWYLKSSDDQSQSRLLNIFNGYLSLICIGHSLPKSLRPRSIETNLASTGRPPGDQPKN